jgi:hypothetical protein
MTALSRHPVNYRPLEKRMKTSTIYDEFRNQSVVVEIAEGPCPCGRETRPIYGEFTGLGHFRIVCLCGRLRFQLRPAE